MTPDAAIDVRGLSIAFGRREVLRDLRLVVPRGSVCALLGRNGAGKTTLLRALLGLLRPAAGAVSVLGEEAWRKRVRLNEHVGCVHDEQGFWPDMTGTEIVRLASRLYARWDETFAQELVGRFNLPMDTRMAGWSKGMPVLLSLLLALAHRPELVLLDEPVANLDPVMRVRFTETVLSYVAESGATVLYSTHLVDEVAAMADRVAILHDGQIAVAGPISDLTASYALLVVLWGSKAVVALPSLPIVRARRREDAAVLIAAADPADIAREMGRQGIDVLEARRPTLQEVFVALLDEDEPGEITRLARERQLDEEVA